MIWFIFGIGLAALSIGCITWGIVRANDASSSDYAPIPGLVLFIISLDLIIQPLLNAIDAHGGLIAALSLTVKLAVGLTVYIYLLKDQRAERLLGYASNFTIDR